MFCTRCGTKRQSHWTFCAQCGNNLASGRVVEEELPEAIGALHIDPSYDKKEMQTTVEEMQTTEKPNSRYDDIDLSAYDFGSDWVEDDGLVSEEDMHQYERILAESGFNTLIQKLEIKNNKWKDVKIKIAITGESGTGKSTLINALRNLSSGDEGFAPIGIVETTKKPTPYPYTENKNVKIWDLPGVGTPNFPKETYLKQIKIERYDFILLVSSSRYKENDTWLAQEITRNHPNSNLVFIRTKVDSDLENYIKGNRSAQLPGQRTLLLKTIKDENMKYLTAAGIKGVNMFLINSYRPDTFEFGKLQTMLIEKVSALKRDAMVLSLSSVSNNIVAEKIRVLEKRIGDVSEIGALCGVMSETKLELEVLREEVLFYKRQLGLDAHSISVLAKVLKKTEEDVYTNINMQSQAILKTSDTFATFYKKYKKSRPPPRPPIVRPILFFPSIEDVTIYQKQCTRVLKCLLKMCSEECRRLQVNLAIWLNK